MITALRVRNRRRIAGIVQILLTRVDEQSAREEAPSSVTGLWGANGSGKSSFVDQIEWLKEGIELGLTHWAHDGIPVDRYQLDDMATGSTTASVECRCKHNLYNYLLNATPEGITREVLERTKASGQRRTLIERNSTDMRVARGLSRPAQLRALFANGQRQRTPALAAGAAPNQELLDEVRAQICAIRIVRPSEKKRDDIHATVTALQTAGGPDTPTGRRRRITAALLENAGIDMGDVRNHPVEGSLDKIGRAGGGSYAIATIAGHAAAVLESGGLLIVDPIDAGIHTVWTEQLIETFSRQPADAEERGQLLFTATGPTLLRKLHKSQIWLCDSRRDQPKIYSLSNFEIRPGINVEDAYMIGRYGGVPGATPTALQLARNDLYQAQRQRTTTNHRAAASH